MPVSVAPLGVRYARFEFDFARKRRLVRGNTDLHFLFVFLRWIRACFSKFRRGTVSWINMQNYSECELNLWITILSDSFLHVCDLFLRYWYIAIDFGVLVSGTDFHSYIIRFSRASVLRTSFYDCLRSKHLFCHGGGEEKLNEETSLKYWRVETSSDKDWRSCKWRPRSGDKINIRVSWESLLVIDNHQRNLIVATVLAID